jgi:hypothetical protein
LVKGSLGRLNVAVVTSDVRTEAQRWLVFCHIRILG